MLLVRTRLFRCSILHLIGVLVRYLGFLPASQLCLYILLALYSVHFIPFTGHYLAEFVDFLLRLLNPFRINVPCSRVSSVIGYLFLPYLHCFSLVIWVVLRFFLSPDLLQPLLIGQYVFHLIPPLFIFILNKYF